MAPLTLLAPDLWRAATWRYKTLRGLSISQRRAAGGRCAGSSAGLCWMMHAVAALRVSLQNCWKGKAWRSKCRRFAEFEIWRPFVDDGLAA